MSIQYLPYIQELIEEQARLGKVEQPLVCRYGHVPQIAPQAYNIYTFAPLTDEQIELLEQSSKRSIPTAYREFLTQVSNGMHLFHRGLSLYGLQGPINRTAGSQGPYELSIPNTYERPRNADSSYFFFASYSRDASRLYMRDGSEKVYYCARRDATPLKEWDSFSDMLIEEIQRLRSLHDTEGMLQEERDTTLPINQGI